MEIRCRPFKFHEGRIHPFIKSEGRCRSFMKSEEMLHPFIFATFCMELQDKVQIISPGSLALGEERIVSIAMIID